MNSGAWTCARCSAPKRRRNEPDELHIIPYLWAETKLAFQWGCCQEESGSHYCNPVLERPPESPFTFDLEVLSRKRNGFLKDLLIWGSSLQCIMIFSASLNWGESCSELLLHLLENKHRWKTAALTLPQPSDLTWALIFCLFYFFPKGQFYSKFMSSCWKTAEHF